MAIAFPTLMPIMLGMDCPKPDTEFKVGTGRFGDDMAVYVSKNHDRRFHRYIPLKRKWYHLHSPAERIRRTVIKAEKIARQLNHQELYIDHESRIAVRDSE